MLPRTGQRRHQKLGPHLKSSRGRHALCWDMSLFDGVAWYIISMYRTSRCRLSIHALICRSKFESEDEVALLSSVLLDQTDGLPAFVAETLKYKGDTLWSQCPQFRICYAVADSMYQFDTGVASMR